MKIYGISTIEWNTTPWMRSTLLHDRVIKLSKAKVHVYSDSDRCLGKMHDHYAKQKWKNKLDGSSVPRDIKNYMESTESQSSSGGIFSQDTPHWNCSETLKINMEHTRNQTRRFQRSDHPHVDVQ